MAKQLVKKSSLTQSEDDVFKCTVTGTLAQQKGSTVAEIQYEHTFNLNKKLVDMGVLFVFKNQVAPRDFPILYPGYQALFTHYLKKVECETNPEAVASNPALLDRPGLLTFIEDYGLPVKPAVYADNDALRQAIYDCIDDEAVFVFNQNERMRKRGIAQYEAQDELVKLNPLPAGPAAGQEANLVTTTSSVLDSDLENDVNAKRANADSSTVMPIAKKPEKVSGADKV